VYSRPHYLPLLDEWIGRPVIKALTGLRRSGKSVLLRQVAERLEQRTEWAGRVVLVDMELLSNDPLREASAFHAWLQPRPRGAVLIDEVQEIAGWERLTASLLAEGWEVWLTGSNAHLLSSELGTLLTGRFIELPVYPLSLQEFDVFSAGRADAFEQHLVWGGLPGLHELGLSERLCSEYLRSVFASILLRDVVARFAVRNVPLLERLARFIASSVGTPHSALSIVRYLKSQRQAVSVETVQSYVRHLEAAYLVHSVPRWDVRGKRHLEIGEKLYLGDVGLFHALMGHSGDINAVLENLVFLELRRRGHLVSHGSVGELEIDFVATRDGQTTYVQVAYLAGAPETRDRELRPLRAVKDHHPKVLLSLDPHPIPTDDGVRHGDIRRFLRGVDLVPAHG
jgi:predicted AAA+ superfamily ATPase